MQVPPEIWGEYATIAAPRGHGARDGDGVRNGAGVREGLGDLTGVAMPAFPVVLQQ